MFDRLKKLLDPGDPAAEKPNLDQLGAALRPLWENHMRHLTHRVLQSRQEVGDRMAIELQLALNESENLRPPFNLYRIDCFHYGPDDPKVDGKFIDIQTPLMLPSLTSFELPGVQMRLQPFFWGRCRLLLSGEADPEFESELRIWFEYWIDPDEENFTSDPFELQQVVHSLSATRGDNGSWSLQVDLGSAPPTAFLDLVRLIGRRFRGQVLIDSHLQDLSGEAGAN